MNENSILRCLILKHHEISYIYETNGIETRIELIYNSIARIPPKIPSPACGQF